MLYKTIMPGGFVVLGDIQFKLGLLLFRAPPSASGNDMSPPRFRSKPQAMPRPSKGKIRLGGLAVSRSTIGGC